MKRMLFLLAFLLAPSLLFAQAQQNLGPRTLSVQDAGTACSLDYACATFTLIQNPPSWTFGISGTYSGTLTFQGTIDGSNWTTIQVSNLANGTASTTTTSTGNFAVTNTGFIGLRVVFTTRSSGSAQVMLSDGGGSGGGGSSGGGGGAVTVADGADVALGTTTDAAVGDATGTLNAHARQIAKSLATGVAATQSGTWSMRNQDGSGNGITSNSTTYTAKFGLDGNWLGTLGTAFTTPGFVDIKGADGNVFVRNATAANFLATATLAAGSALAGEIVPVTTATTTDTALRCVLVSAASTNATNCKNSAGNVYGYRFVNTTSTIYYLRMYNLTSAPTCSSATGFVETIPIPANTAGAGIVAIEPMGEGYATGIGFCFTGGSSSTDNTNAATGVFGTILYK